MHTFLLFMLFSGTNISTCHVLIVLSTPRIFKQNFSKLWMCLYFKRESGIISIATGILFPLLAYTYTYNCYLYMPSWGPDFVNKLILFYSILYMYPAILQLNSSPIDIILDYFLYKSVTKLLSCCHSRFISMKRKFK
jgi:hypothetical protein